MHRVPDYVLCCWRFVRLGPAWPNGEWKVYAIRPKLFGEHENIKQKKIERKKPDTRRRDRNLPNDMYVQDLAIRPANAFPIKTGL